MKSLVIDDEPDARARLARLVKKHPEIQVIAEARNGLEAIEEIEQLQPELLFLDIEMPGLNGFEVLRAIPENIALPLVIFVTGYDQHALAAFEANALAYLLKPVEPERLARAVERALKLNVAEDDKENERNQILRISREAPRPLRQVVCRKQGRALLIPAEQILWFQTDGGIVKAKTASDSFWVNYQITELESALPEDLFFRARREVLVNMSKIKEIKPYFKSSFLLVMSDSAATEIAVSERQAHPFRQRLPGL
jgi:two-component system LytT family response regulator